MYDVILMDFHMPYMNGLETIEKIRANFRNDKQDIILLHSSSDDDQISKASETFAIKQHLVKPVKMTDLYHALSRLHQNDSQLQPDVPARPISISTRPVNILLVEDNKINQLLTKTILARIMPNSLVIEAVNGQEAVEACRTQQPDLILMDVQMPVMNGYEATRRIREYNHQVPIIALTAGTVKGEREKCLAAGMSDFVTKPVIESAIATLLKKWLLPDTSDEETASNLREQVRCFDPQVIKSIAGNDDYLFRELLEAAQEELNASFIALDLQAKNEDLTALKATGHKLKGTALSAGMQNLAQLSQALEHSDPVEDEILKNLLERIKLEINQIQHLIRTR